MIEKCREILSKYNVPQRHSDFQIEKFIIGKEHSFNGRMWQCMREIETRYESLVNINFEIERGNLKYPPDRKNPFSWYFKCISTKSFLGIQSPSVKSK